jgi:hypothetical protein
MTLFLCRRSTIILSTSRPQSAFCEVVLSTSLCRWRRRSLASVALRYMVCAVWATNRGNVRRCARLIASSGWRRSPGGCCEIVVRIRSRSDDSEAFPPFGVATPRQIRPPTAPRQHPTPKAAQNTRRRQRICPDSCVFSDACSFALSQRPQSDHDF